MTTLGYAILGLLAREPLSGYDLMQRMKAPVGFFWRAHHSQIYTELARLEERGMVAHHLVTQQGRPDKKVYEATGAGLAALKEWTTTPVAPRATRDELVLKAYSLWLSDPGEALPLFREHERRHEEQLQRYEEIKARMEREWGSDINKVGSPRFASYAALRRGIGYEREYVDWCRWVADQLEKSIDGQG